MPTLGDRWLAWLILQSSDAYDGLLRDRKRQLLSGLRGTVVEIGPGTGANLKYYARDTQWIGIEPNAVMHVYLRREAASRGVASDVRLGAAELLEIESGTADAVVSTAVLCSVRDVRRSIAEARRVLKTGGKLVFIEHVAAAPGTAVHLLQRGVRPLWRCCAGGCDPARNTGAEIERAGFERVDIDRFRLPLGPVAPHIAGVAIR